MLPVIKRLQRRRVERVNKFHMIMKLQDFKGLSSLQKMEAARLRGQSEVSM